MKKQSLYAASAMVAVTLMMASPVMAQGNGAAPAAPPAAAMQQGKAAMTTNMSPEGQAIIQQARESVRAQNQGLFDQIKAKKAEKDALLKAPTVDKAALEAKTAEIKALREQAMKARSDAMNEAMTKLSPEDRAAFVDARNKKMENMGGKFQGKGGMMHGTKNGAPRAAK